MQGWPFLFFFVSLIKTFLSNNMLKMLKKCQNKYFRASNTAKYSSSPPTMIGTKLSRRVFSR